VRGPAHAKLNLALVVGPRRADGMHEVLTLLQRLDLVDEIVVEPAESTTVDGFPDDTLVRRALAVLDAPHGWRVVIDKHIPVAAGLGGGSSDAATALRLASAQLETPVDDQRLHELAASVGADVPFFLRTGPQLASGVGATLEPAVLPQGFVACLLLPDGTAKTSTRAAARVDAFRLALAHIRVPRDLAGLPPNDLARSAHAAALLAEGAFRADVSGAGPVVYGLFEERAAAELACAALSRLGRTCVAGPAW